MRSSRPRTLGIGPKDGFIVSPHLPRHCRDMTRSTASITSGRRCFSKSTSNGANIKSQPDPLARRPNRECDPYGLGGKPLSYREATIQLETLENGWQLLDRKAEPNSTDTSNDQDMHNDNKTPPAALVREFHHADYLAAARFVQTIAAVAHQNNHYPTISMERRLLSRKAAWQITTTVTCQTVTLQGLSHSDFFIAMVRYYDGIATHVLLPVLHKYCERFQVSSCCLSPFLPVD